MSRSVCLDSIAANFPATAFPFLWAVKPQKMNTPMKNLAKRILGRRAVGVSTAAFFLFTGATAKLSAQTVNTLTDLLPYLDDDNVSVTLSPGTYTVTAADIANGTIGYTEPLADTRAVLLVEGSNSTYDFTGVTLQIETDVLQAWGNKDVYGIQMLGNDTTIKNLKLEYTGNTRPSKRATAIVMDGSGNALDGVHMTVRGSYPYGYGDAFGKGGSFTIKHYKHSSLLIRGLNNLVKNCTVIHRSYGHAIFMQGAESPTIQGCYVEGEVRTTDDMLSETSGPAYDINFMTDWGYTLPAGYMLSLGEEGIRAYNAGRTIINGVRLASRPASNVTVKDCTVKNMRGGITLAHASGTKYVEGCTVVACEQGYALGTGTVVNSGADAIYGPVYKNTYSSDNGYVADITILPPSGAYFNGTGAVAYLGGKNHDLTFRCPDPSPNTNLEVRVSGDLQNIRMLNGNNPSQNNLTSTDIVVDNLSSYPMVLHADSSGTTGTSAGPVTDNGTNNSIGTASVQTLPAPWSFKDVGSVGAAGTSTYSNGTYTIEGSGADIWGKVDEFHYVFHRTAGTELSITAKVDSVENTNAWAKAGVMFRENDGPVSKNVALVVTPSRGISMQWRDEHCEASSYTRDASLSAPYWVRLERSGDTFTGSVSSDGSNWTVLSTVTLEMNLGLTTGLCVTSHNDGVLCTGTFSNVEVSGGDLVGYWPIDGTTGTTVDDHSGYDRFASLTGATVAGGVNASDALSFDGVDDTVWVAPEVFTDIEDEVSIAMWVNGDASQPLNDSVFYAVDSSNQRVLNIHLPWSNSQVYWDAGNGGGSGYDRINKTANSGDYEGAWNHWVFTKNATTGDMKIYLNGSLWHSGTGKTKTMAGIAEARIGSAITGNYYAGLIDEVMVYKTELTAAEVSVLYNSY